MECAILRDVDRVSCQFAQVRFGLRELMTSRVSGEPSALLQLALLLSRLALRPGHTERLRDFVKAAIEPLRDFVSGALGEVALRTLS